MKKIFTTIFLILMILAVAGVAFAPQQAEAGLFDVIRCAMNPELCTAATTAGIGGNIFNVVFEALGNFVLMVSSWFLGLAGVILNMSIILTLNIKALYEATPAIEQTWVVIRNISSIFIIFALLYFSILKILSIGDHRLGDLIKNIVVAGLLINFSLFFTKVLIDASNLISLQFYRAIVPRSQNINLTKEGIGKVLTSSFYSGFGISEVFQQSLKIQKIYNGKQGILKTANTSFMIAVSTLAGSMLMIIAGISFFAAALAFTVRLIRLLLALSFSPLYFVGMVFPKIRDKMSDLWSAYFTKQLLFMPVYLLLMYVSLQFISGAGFFQKLDASQSQQGSGSVAGILLADAGLIFQYTIALILINIPLIAAIQIGGVLPKWASEVKGYAQKWVGGIGSVARGAAGFAARHTIGRGTSKLAESEFAKDMASRGVIGEYTYKGLKSVSKGYDEKLEKQVVAKTKFAESLGHDKSAMNIAQAQLRNLNSQLAQAQAANQPTANLRTAVGNVKRAITDLENRRKDTYARRINNRSADTLFTKIARKNKVAAAKLQIPIIEDQISHHKDDLKETRADIKQLRQAITNNPQGTGTIAIPGVTGLATPAQETRMNQLLADQLAHTNNINAQEALLDNLKLIS